MSIKGYLEQAKGFADRNSPTILTSLGVLGLINTARLAYKAGIKASRVSNERIREYLEDFKDYKEMGDKQSQTSIVKKLAMEAATVYGPPVAMGAVSTACIIGSNCISTKRIAAISAAYSLTEAALKDYKEKALEVVGDKKVRQIKEAIAKDKVLKNPPPKDDSQILMTGTGDVLCYDAYSGRYYISNAAKIEKAVNKLSAECLSDMYISLNEFWDEIGLPRLPMGNDYGWNIDDTFDGILPISLTAILTDDQRPCLCVDYDVSPRFDYRNIR